MSSAQLESVAAQLQVLDHTPTETTLRLPEHSPGEWDQVVDAWREADLSLLEVHRERRTLEEDVLAGTAGGGERKRWSRRCDLKNQRPAFLAGLWSFVVSLQSSFAPLAYAAGCQWNIGLHLDAFDVFFRPRIDADRFAFFENAGPLITAPVSSVTGLVTLVAVLPRAPGSHWVIFKRHLVRRSMLIGALLYNVTVQDDRFQQPLGLCPDDACGNFVLLVVVVVHNTKLSPDAVKILGVDRFDIGFVKAIAGFVGAVERRAADQVLEAAFVKRLAFAGLHKVSFHHQIRIAVDLNLDPFLEIARIVSHQTLLQVGFRDVLVKLKVR